MRYLMGILAAVWIVAGAGRAGAAATAPAAGATTARADSPPGATVAQADAKGRIKAILAGGEFLEIGTDLAVAAPGWKVSRRLGDVANIRAEVRGGQRTWRGTLDAAVDFEQELAESGGAIRLSLRLTAQRDADLTGVFLFIHVPTGSFAGGRCEALPAEGKAAPAAATMPAEPPKQHQFLHGRTKGLAFIAADGKTRLEIALDRELPFTVQDGRKWRSARYDAFFQLMGGRVRQGEQAEAAVTLRLTAPPDDRPAALTLDGAIRRYRFDGFGGNFCYGVDSPVTRHNLANIPMGYARVGMKLEQWEPRNDNDSPDQADWSYYESRDREGSQVRADFLLARQLAERKVPYDSSIWRVPEFMTADPGSGPEARSRKLPREKWPEVLEGIGSYLLHGKRKYGTEPELFSFNESDIGCFVAMTAEEHRDWIKACGAYLAKQGLKTKMLLGDATRNGGVTFIQPAAADQEAMRYVGAVAFHTWHKGPEEYRSWRDAAKRIQRPLLATEVGPDAAAWQDRSYNLLPYFLNELRMYQEILLHADVQALLEWEYTSDYALLERERGADGAERLRPAARYWMIRQFATRTPRPAWALQTASDHPKVFFTAFAGPAGAKELVLHVANVGARRRATLAGLPQGLARLHAVQATWAGGSQNLPPVAVRDGKAELDLPPMGLLTLTTEP